MLSSKGIFNIYPQYSKIKGKISRLPTFFFICLRRFLILQYLFMKIRKAVVILAFICLALANNLCGNGVKDPQEFCDPNQPYFKEITQIQCSQNCDRVYYGRLRITEDCGTNEQIEGDEKCENGPSVPYYEAHNGCRYCLPALGFSCRDGKCKETCGDQMIQTKQSCEESLECIVLRDEECDDNNDIKCFECRKLSEKIGKSILRNLQQNNPNSDNSDNCGNGNNSGNQGNCENDNGGNNNGGNNNGGNNSGGNNNGGNNNGGNNNGGNNNGGNNNGGNNNGGGNSDNSDNCGKGNNQGNQGNCRDDNDGGGDNGGGDNGGGDNGGGDNGGGDNGGGDNGGGDNGGGDNGGGDNGGGDNGGGDNGGGDNGDGDNGDGDNGGGNNFCGNGVRQLPEQCDNGNRPGCFGCVQGLYYTCEEDSNNFSVCTKRAMCGNGIREFPEECDNTNNKGCMNCLKDPGYECTQNSQGFSMCKKIHQNNCGNNVQEEGQGCDNGRREGCRNCQVENGYYCIGRLGTASNCDRIAGCGNGRWELNIREECDDNNVKPNDGCSSRCKIEDGWKCENPYLNGLSYCVRIGSNIDSSCGNGRLEKNKNQQCDDGDQISGNGCARDCTIQRGWYCYLRGETSLCKYKGMAEMCGNGFLEDFSFEKCDDANTRNNDGCSSSCKIEPGYVCSHPLQSMPSYCIRICGNRNYQPKYGEGCDDGNIIPNDGCSPVCQIEPGYECPINREGRQSVCQMKGAMRPVVCGNGLIEYGQNCDDNNLRRGDGCDHNCRIEKGWNCDNSSPSKCYRRSLCGNGIIEANEECDDKNTKSMDGCSASCLEEPNWMCSTLYHGIPSVCKPINKCGNGIFETERNEFCDDGSQYGHDGCVNCVVQPGWTCISNIPGQLSVCIKSKCGDGRFNPHSEQCDDQNDRAGDGCSRCKIEQRWVCQNTFNQRSICYFQCGNGAYQPEHYEECDDGNNRFGDGCDRCVREPGFYCKNQIGKKSYCYRSTQTISQCGNGELDEDEKCDDGNNEEGDGCENCKVIRPAKCLNKYGMKSVCFYEDICYYQHYIIPEIILTLEAQKLLEDTIFESANGRVRILLFAVIRWENDRNYLRQDEYSELYDALVTKAGSQLSVINREIFGCTGIQL